ncbi:MAG: hypothetical protein IJA89_05465 [Clostridia bacterium]|nr:hypothetical protein [Clostridia bacterium]
MHFIFCLLPTSIRHSVLTAKGGESAKLRFAHLGVVLPLRATLASEA